MILDNLRYACRNLRAAPGFTVTAILSLALGIGATLAMFTVVNSILLKPLSFRGPDELVFVTQTGTTMPSINQFVGIAPPQFLHWRDAIRSFESIGLIQKASVNLTGSGSPETLGAARISAGFFETLGVTPLRGRWFYRSEEKRGGPNVAIISANMWQERFAADSQIVGSKIVLNGVPHEVVGVTPFNLHLFPGRQLHSVYDLSDQTDIFVPARFSVAQEQGTDWAVSYLCIARLKAGVTPTSARAELDSSMPRFLPPGLPGRYWTIVRPLQSALVGATSSALWLLLFAVALLLMIACVNVANLSLVRAVQRAREHALRVALGAGRRDLIIYSFTESLLLSLAGTALGIIASMWITDTVISLAPARIPRLDEVSVDGTVAVFSVMVCVLTTVMFGILPAWRASRADPQQSLSAAGWRNTDSRRSGQIRSVLVSAEVALGTVLAIGSGLLLNSLHHMMTTPKGFVGDNVLVADFTLPSSKYQAVAARGRFFGGLKDQLSPFPGVAHIAATSVMPLEAERLAPAVIQESDVFNTGQVVTWPVVSSEYFATLGIPLRDGRFFQEDEPDAVAVVSESAARVLWPGENPIGKKLSFPQSPRKWLRVVGVAGDVLSAGLDRASTPAIYRPYSQFAASAFRLVAQTTALPSAFRKTLREAVNAVDSEIPVAEVRTMSDLIGKSAQERRFQTGLLTVFGFAAVLLAAIGIYGVVANGIAQRRKEIGLCIALGANRLNVAHLVFRSGMAPVLLGLAAGVVMSMLLARLIASLLFQVGALDWITFFGAALVLASAGALPCWLVARHACRIDPAVCLRID